MGHPKRAAVYCRISDDRRGTEAGVDRQRQDCIALVERNGWTLVPDPDGRDTFTDNDISAFSGKARPAYQRLIDTMKAGDVDVVVAWHPDRLHRRPVELEHWITLQEATRTTVATVQTGQYDLATANGRQMARIGAAIASGESEHKSDRVRRAMLQRAEQGKVHGALRTYGLKGTRNDDGTHTWQVVEEEAEVIRDAARRVLAGESMLSVVNDLTDRGIPTLRGAARWAPGTLRNILVSARVAGWREHTPGRKVTAAPWGGGEFVAEAEWPAILPRVTVERLRLLLNNPAAQRGASTRSYLLSNGLLLCECDAPLRGRPRASGGRDYACSSPASNGTGCGRVTVNAAAVEDYVVAVVREGIDSGEVAKRLRRDDGEDVDAAWDAVATLEKDLAELGADFGNGRISRGEWIAAREPLKARLEQAGRTLARQQGGGRLAGWDAQWEAAQGSVERQRALLRLALTSVTVSRSTRRGFNRFDPDRVALQWRA